MISSLAMASFYPATSVTKPPPTTSTGSCKKMSITRYMVDHHRIELLYLAVDTKFGHRVDDAQKGRDGLRLLADLGLVYFET